MQHWIQVTIPPKAEGKRLSDYLAEAGYPLRAECGGRGSCGKCRVQWISGRFTTDPQGTHPAVPDEKGFLLACRVFCTHAEAVIRLPITELPHPTPALAGSPCRDEPIGIALDIGTTTLAAALVDLRDGTLLRTTTRLNPQGSFGADVMSRISAVMEQPSRLTRLQALLLEAVRAMLAELTQAQTLSRMVVVGNPTMLHLFCGISPVTMGTAPFTPVFTEARSLSGDSLGLNVTTVTLLPSISAFIGGDLTAGMLAVRLTDHEEPALLLDLGTNGEMLLYTGNRHGGGLYGASTAAGPALEGAGISSGMGGVSGAVSAVKWNGATLTCETIGGTAPRGICGSGLVDLIALLRLRELVDETGYPEEDPFVYAQGLAVTGEDIRAFQLAKSAIRAGMEVLCQEAGIPPLSLSRLYVAGGLGQHVRVNAAIQVGLLPRLPRARILSAGNTALTGAAMALKEPLLIETLSREAIRCQTVDLNLSPTFSEEFMAHMYFPPVDT